MWCRLLHRSFWPSLSNSSFLADNVYQAGLILGLVKLNNPDYNLQGWHSTPLTIAIAIICTLFNIFLTGRLPLVEVLVLILHVLGVFVIIIPLWIMAPRGNMHETIFEFTSSSGWQPVSLASTIGIIPSIGMLIGYDCSIHMSEETQDASKTIPKVIVWAVAGNALLLLIVGISYIFCLGDVDSALNSDTYQPVIQVFYNATQSKAGTSVMVAVIIVVFMSACIGQVATASRQLWSFARDQGVPFSRQLEVVPPSYGIPVPSIILTCIITCLLSLINIGGFPRHPLSLQISNSPRRLIHRLQRFQLPRCCLDPLLIHHHHWLHHLPPHCWPPSPASPMVLGQTWSADQYHFALLHHAHALLLLLAALQASGCGQHVSHQPSTSSNSLH